MFYDPYYEELLRRKKQRDASVAKILPPRKDETESLTPDCDKTRIINISDSFDSRESGIHNPEFGKDSPRRDSPAVANDTTAARTIEQLERAMHSLYSELDRQKRQLGEYMEREARASREVSRLRSKLKSEDRSQYVPTEEFHQLEAKYINALKLVDDLNWRLNQLSPR